MRRKPDQPNPEDVLHRRFNRIVVMEESRIVADRSMAVEPALRYISNIQQKFNDISQAQQARGVEMCKKASLE